MAEPSGMAQPPAEGDLRGSDLSAHLIEQGVATKGHVFKSDDARMLFRNKYIVYFGDSIVRGMYKDMVQFLHSDDMVDRESLRAKAEDSFRNDRRTAFLDAGNNIQFVEGRQFMSDNYRVEYYFITRVYQDRIEAMIKFWEAERAKAKREGQGRSCHVPDYVFFSSALWDMYWYNTKDPTQPNVDGYQTHLMSLFDRLRRALPINETLIVFLLAMPLDSHVKRAGVFNETLDLGGLGEYRVHMMEANYVATRVAQMYCVDVLDLMYYMRPLMRHRESDGVHWNCIVNRHITELIMVHIIDTLSAVRTIPKQLMSRMKAIKSRMASAGDMPEHIASTNSVPPFLLTWAEQFADAAANARIVAADGASGSVPRALAQPTDDDVVRRMWPVGGAGDSAQNFLKIKEEAEALRRLNAKDGLPAAKGEQRDMLEVAAAAKLFKVD